MFGGMTKQAWMRSAKLEGDMVMGVARGCEVEEVGLNLTVVLESPNSLVEET